MCVCETFCLMLTLMLMLVLTMAVDDEFPWRLLGLR